MASIKMSGHDRPRLATLISGGLLEKHLSQDIHLFLQKEQLPINEILTTVFLCK